MALDFRALASKPLDDVKRPPAYPQGEARGVIVNHKFDESRFADKETGEKHAVCNFQIRVDSYLDSALDQEFQKMKQEFPALANKTMPREMPISGGNEYITKSFLEGLGINTSGRTFADTIPETTGMNVTFEVTQRFDKNDPEKVYNDVRNLRAAN